MRHIDTPDVPLAGASEVRRVHRVRLRGADQRGPHQEAVVVIQGARLIVVVIKVELKIVPVEKEILPRKIRDDNILRPPHHQRVQAAVGIFLERTEEPDVPLIAIRLEVAEEQHSRIAVGKNESAKIAGERLDARADRNKIVVRAQVRQLVLNEQFLERDVPIEARRSVSGIDIYDASLVSAEKIDVEDRRRLEFPVQRLESRIAVKQIERSDEVLLHAVLVAAAEEIGSAAFTKVQTTAYKM